MIKCLAFDIQGVITSTGDKIREKLTNEGFDKSLLQLATAKNGLIAKKYIEGLINWDEYLSEVKKIFPNDYKYILDSYYNTNNLVRITKSFWLKNIQEKYEINIDLSIFNSEDKSASTLELIKELYKIYPLCLFSGNGKEKIIKLQEEYKLLDYFKYKVFSYDIHKDKPSDEMFQALINAIPYNPKECLYFDDKEYNLDKALKYGFNCILIKE